MNRPLYVWIAFFACLALVLGSMGWVSATVLRLDSESLAARRQAALEENVRLALWRLDSAVSPLVGRENARPAHAYQAFYSARWAYTRMYAQLDAGQVMVPSPLLTERHPLIRMHFQYTPGGELSSPQAPSGNMRDLAESGFASHEDVTAAAARLEALRGLLDRAELAAAVGLSGPSKLAAAGPPSQVSGLGLRQPQAAMRPNAGQVGQSDQEQQAYQTVATRSTIPVQKAMSANEFEARNRVAQQNAVQANMANQAFQPSPEQAVKPEQAGTRTGPGSERPQTSLMTAVWSHGELLLVRRAELDGRQVVQGAWLDWPAMRAELLAEVEDLLPAARLEPLAAGARGRPVSRMAALPIELVSGALSSVAGSDLSPIQLSLVIAWAFALLAAAAVGLVLKATVALSERRAAFVSAVTHELRTPLTTFRMYTEMLAEGMVPQEERRQRYYRTLHAEADRLDHLVQNVLAYARLERKPQARRPARVSVADALARTTERLGERSAQQDMRLELEISEQARAAELRVDPEALGRILFNLVDNASKYAAAAEDRRIHLRVERAGKSVRFEVCDHGPGVEPALAARLFTPFSKSAEAAAESAPGVGLGLALSRRLARRMGGDLSLARPATGPGACFSLSLPLAPERAA